MGAFSIWHWMIVLIVVLVLFGLPILAVAMENSDRRVNRQVFIYWICVFIGFEFGMEFIGGWFGYGEEAGQIGMSVGFLMLYPLFQRYVRRARDIGKGKAIAYWSIVPIINLATTFILMTKKNSALPTDEIQPQGQEAATTIIT